MNGTYSDFSRYMARYIVGYMARYNVTHYSYVINSMIQLSNSLYTQLTHSYYIINTH